jgi:hypothetical protein
VRHAGAFTCLLALSFGLCRGSYAQGIQYEIQKLTPSGADTCATAQIIPVNLPKPGELDHVISIVDVTWDLSAFIGGKYGFPPGDPCR